jgi:hypothetical protein
MAWFDEKHLFPHHVLLTAACRMKKDDFSSSEADLRNVNIVIEAIQELVGLCVEWNCVY